MNYQVISIVPTVYQLNSVSRLMGGYEMWGGGRYGFSRSFDTEDEAIQWMLERNDFLWELDYLTLEEYKENIESINTQQTMTYDAAYAKCERL